MRLQASGKFKTKSFMPRTTIPKRLFSPPLLSAQFQQFKQDMLDEFGDDISVVSLSAQLAVEQLLCVEFAQGLEL